MEHLTPAKIVEELDKFIVGQKDAKKAVAVALRNRWRRAHVKEELRDEIHPKNILMIGPTGVGKTEIARRLAKLTDAPFLKVEATKYTEVGYVGKDVESMIRDLTEISVNMVKAIEKEKVKAKAAENTEERLLDLIVPDSAPPPSPEEMLIPLKVENTTREKFRAMLRKGELDDREVQIDIKEKQGLEVMAIPGMPDMEHHVREMMDNFMPKKNRRRKMKVNEAKKYLEQEEASKLVDMDRVIPLALDWAQTRGIIFLDEMDKVTVSKDDYKGGPGVSREGVQRDLLPIVEGSTVNTKYGMVKTDDILFIGAGAFHQSKPSDLIPELQGRFPIRVELKNLTTDDFFRILTEPKNSLVKQYTALLETEKVELNFHESAIRTMCELAADVNANTENIGARRLHTVLERVVEEVSFNAPDLAGQTIDITPEYVKLRVQDLTKNEDLSRYIL